MLQLESLSKHFGEFVALEQIAFSVQEGTFFSLLGASGCGKTTLLRLIGGFESPTSGRILLDGKDITHFTPQQRPTAMVFQNYALFPNMTVAENVRYGLDVRKLSTADKAEKVAKALKRVEMDRVADKPVTQLSGGQQQRVALARAMALEPRILLFDEPLSNLDVALRSSARAEIKQLQREAGITAIYVTHDQEEALSLSDEIAVMQNGNIAQIGSPRDLYFHPTSESVAKFIGGTNIIRDTALIRAWIGDSAKENAVMGVKPEHWQLVEDENAPIFEVVSSEFLGVHSAYFLRHHETQIRILLSPNEVLETQIKIRPTSWQLF